MAFELPLTLLLLYLRANIEIDGEDDDVGNNVEDAHSIEHLRVFERYLLRDLHHA